MSKLCYKTLVSAKGFNSKATTLTVLVANTTALNVKLQIGSEKEVIQVQESTLQLNTGSQLSKA